MIEYYGGNDYHGMSKEEMGEMMQKWFAWLGTFKEQIVDHGGPLMDGREITTSGSVPITSEMWPAKGYFCIEVENMDDAIAISQGCPTIVDNEENATMRVYEAMPMPQMS